MSDFTIALAGNPNVGKSTVFNALTGLKQHTGNWTGKTVDCCSGAFRHQGYEITAEDLPGAYSLSAYSREESVTRHCLLTRKYDCVIIVLDAGLPERNLCFALEVLSVAEKAVVCLNLIDEAKNKGLIIDEKALSEALGVPVISCCAPKKQGLGALKDAVTAVCSDERYCCPKRCLSGEEPKRASEIAARCVTVTKTSKQTRDRRFDKILTSKMFGLPLLLLFCAALFWLTAVGANYPSQALTMLFSQIRQGLTGLCAAFQAPKPVSGILIDGIYTSLSWVVAVMLPPMAVFFPLFALIEDAGLLPRIAFNLDRIFARCGAHGKQSLCMMMGLGCNACGVTGCRIIETDKERKIAVLTNNFMPCNGRLPILIAILTLYFTGAGFAGSAAVAALMVPVLCGCIALTLLCSRLLSKCLRRESHAGFALELPPYRKPQIIKTLVRSFLDKTLLVLGRAVIAAAPAGALIWLCANITIKDSTILQNCIAFFDPFGRFIGLDGAIVMAFLLGFPANETVIPVLLMAYTNGEALTDFSGYPELFSLLSAHGWTTTTAVCMIVMTICHFPCATTCMTIKKETGSLCQTLAAMALPTVIGILICSVISGLMP